MIKIIWVFILLFISASEVLAVPSVPNYSYSEMYMYDNQDSQTNYQESEANKKISDPFFVINKHIFNINYIVDAGILSPIAATYTYVVPPRGRARVGDFISNLGEPINFFNLMFQGRFAQARISLARFMTNTVMGFGGIMDVATQLKLEYKGEDFGQTLARYKVPRGPYLVAPLLGPTTLRDLSGKVVDFFLNPFKYILTRTERDVVNGVWIIHKRADADQIVKTINNSLNPYETAKSLYIQNRESQINN